jgi:hypothetical protein
MNEDEVVFDFVKRCIFMQSMILPILHSDPSFRVRISVLLEFIKENILQDSEANIEERKQQIIDFIKSINK